jgi:outer membrane protein TolC
MSLSRLRLAVVGLCLFALNGCFPRLSVPAPIMPEQRSIGLRDPAQLPRAQIPDLPPPPTVGRQTGVTDRHLSLDEAIRITLENSKVVRVLAGVTAVSSTRTIYDPAISNTIIDQEQARFDPKVDVSNTFDRLEPPLGVFDALDPRGARIAGVRTDAYSLATGLSKTTITGGTARLGFTDDLARSQPGVFPLNPQNQHAATLSYTQPLLQGGGIAPNLAPIVIARINTERSYFQLKDALQESVRGVIEAYWALVFARTDEWARKQQVAQGQWAYERAEARKAKGLGSEGEVAQTRLALANFKAAAIGAEANVIQREAALRNILGLPPSDATRLVPVSPPSANRVVVHWDEIVRLAEAQRPDLIELNLIIEADQQFIVQARNQALPKVDASLLYQWNGLEGRTPSRAQLSTEAGQFTDWSLGVNFSVPLGLRQGRANLRQQELILARDRANLDQGLHAAAHDLATSTRNLAQFFEQYKSFKEAREAARVNLAQQEADFRAGRTIFLNVLQAITDWGNAVSAEAQALTQYNTELATLERQTGTILETHGVHFYEERFASIGPLGRLAKPRSYPLSLPPGMNANRYPTMSTPAENVFDLKGPTPPDSK